MKLVIDLDQHRSSPKPITSFAAHYNLAQHLMQHDPLPLDNVMPLPDRPWYRRAWTWLLTRLGIYE
jgi:hypothetical protein